MTRQVVSNAARDDVRKILAYLREHAGRQIALRYALDFDAAFDRIASSPGHGSPRSEFGPETRVTVIDPYLIFYDAPPKARAILVLRILHGRRNITPELIAHGREKRPN